jgi:hypothetical protein
MGEQKNYYFAQKFLTFESNCPILENFFKWIFLKVIDKNLTL